MGRSSFNRRHFLLNGSAGVASLLLGCSEKSAYKGPPGEALSKQGADAGDPDQQTSCIATSPDITGPYWREGIPIRNNFDLYGHRGQRLVLRGRVQDGACRPIADAVIEMWHAHPSAIPAESLTPADTVGYDTASEGFRYYGQFSTDSEGTYTLTTLKPGWYLNGASFRPSHIHVKVYVGGVERLTTQLYFQNDPFIPSDPWAAAAPERAVELLTSDPGLLSGRFDFRV